MWTASTCIPVSVFLDTSERGELLLSCVCSMTKYNGPIVKFVLNHCLLLETVAVGYLHK